MTQKTAPLYDDENIFARILRGELPCKKVYEDSDVLAFEDINPQAKIHILIIPKGRYVSWDDFSQQADPGQMVALMRAAGMIACDYGLDQSGYRLLTNSGADGGQEVPHLHLHLFGGEALGPMLPRRSSEKG